jgi:hypothetical protein
MCHWNSLSPTFDVVKTTKCILSSMRFARWWRISLHLPWTTQFREWVFETQLPGLLYYCPRTLGDVSDGKSFLTKLPKLHALIHDLLENQKDSKSPRKKSAFQGLILSRTFRIFSHGMQRDDDVRDLGTLLKKVLLTRTDFKVEIHSGIASWSVWDDHWRLSIGETWDLQQCVTIPTLERMFFFGTSFVVTLSLLSVQKHDCPSSSFLFCDILFLRQNRKSRDPCLSHNFGSYNI